MKLKIHKKSKKVLILILILLTVFSGLQLFLPMAMTKTLISESILYEATCEPKAGYQVVINPNEVFPGTTQKEGEFYSKKILNYIQTDFEVNYKGSKAVPLDIEYQILATVNGYQGEDPDKVNYWSKSFPLTNKKVLKEDRSSTWSKKERVNFQLSGYDAFAVRAKEITGMEVGNEVILSMTGKITAHTDKEDLDTPFDVNIRIPLMEDVFQITKSNVDPIMKNVTAKVETPAPIDLFRTVSYGILLGFCLIGLIILIVFTREPNAQELLFRKVNGTLKNYGSRIVALQSIPKMNYRQCYKVHSMKDLIKIADELQKPIFYEVDKDTVVKDYEFHIIENDTLYSLFLDSSEA